MRVAADAWHAHACTLPTPAHGQGRQALQALHTHSGVALHTLEVRAAVHDGDRGRDGWFSLILLWQGHADNGLAFFQRITPGALQGAASGRRTAWLPGVVGFLLFNDLLLCIGGRGLGDDLRGRGRRGQPA
eukprot:scaffold119812_cov20-Tisochrysis_lutea.AAC.3